MVAKVNAVVGGAQPDYAVVAVVVLYRRLFVEFWSGGRIF